MLELPGYEKFHKPMTWKRQVVGHVTDSSVKPEGQWGCIRTITSREEPKPGKKGILMIRIIKKKYRRTKYCPLQLDPHILKLDKHWELFLTESKCQYICKGTK